jgi:hypothetical protein
LRFEKNQEPEPPTARRAPWQALRRSRRGRLPAKLTEERGPYETSYVIALGYPDRDTVIR